MAGHCVSRAVHSWLTRGLASEESGRLFGLRSTLFAIEKHLKPRVSVQNLGEEEENTLWQSLIFQISPTGLFATRPRVSRIATRDASCADQVLRAALPAKIGETLFPSEITVQGGEVQGP